MEFIGFGNGEGSVDLRLEIFDYQVRCAVEVLACERGYEDLKRNIKNCLEANEGKLG